MNREEMNEKYANQGQTIDVHSLKNVYVFQIAIVLLFNITTNTTFILSRPRKQLKIDKKQITQPNDTTFTHLTLLQPKEN